MREPEEPTPEEISERNCQVLCDAMREYIQPLFPPGYSLTLLARRERLEDNPIILTQDSFDNLRAMLEFMAQKKEEGRTIHRWEIPANLEIPPEELTDADRREIRRKLGLG